MRIYLILAFFVFPLSGISQNSKGQRTNQENYQWLMELTEKGLDVSRDSIQFSKEFQRAWKEEEYRASLFPETYTWEPALQFIQDQELKKAFWYFINLYPENEKNKKLVIRSVLAYDQLFKMDEVLVNTFYTYCFMDPQVNIVTNGIPEITHPDILEAKLRNVKEIIGYIHRFREQQQSSNPAVK